MKHSRDDLTLPDLRYERATGSGIDPDRDPEVSPAPRRSTAACWSPEHVDEVEAEMTSGGEAFFHVSGCGTRRLGHPQPEPHPEDWLHLHYRDKALMLRAGSRR